MSTINTISEFLLQAGTEYRVYDMARGIRPIDNQHFLEMENGTVAATYPRQQHTWFGVLFFNRKLSSEQYIWFVKLPLDEQGLVITAGRQQFLQIVVEALGQSLDKQNNPNNQLPENPFTFVPNQQQLADFNSICRAALDVPPSTHLNVMEQYVVDPLGTSWQTVPIQGIADFVTSIQNQGAKNVLLEHFVNLAPEIQHAVCASLENHPIDEQLTTLLISWYWQDPNDQDKLNSTLRGLGQSQAKSAVLQFIDNILTSPNGRTNTTLMLIAARHWQYLDDTHILKLYIERLAQCPHGSFIGLFPDLVQIPSIRQTMLGVVRWPEKSQALTLAIGQLFGQKS